MGTIMDTRIDEIKRCEEKIRELSSSEENRRRSGFWKDDAHANDYIWHPSPKEKGVIPFSFELERIGYSQILNFSLSEFYVDPIEFVLRTMQSNIYRFETFKDCTPIGKAVTYWPGVGFEVSLFGQPQQYTEEDAWVGKDPVYKERVPIGSVEIPDFYNYPVMKDAIAFYEKMCELVSDDFEVIFPQWCRSAWGVAWQLRGIDNLIIDYFEDPEWVDSFLKKLNAARFDYSENREKFLGKKRTAANLYNDEVSVPVVSPRMYRDLIRPSETAVSEFFGGINYWHSCGNTTELIPLIDEVPNVQMVHVSPWTDVWKAAEGYTKGNKALEIVLHPVEDVLYPTSEESLRKRLTDVQEATEGFYRTVRADGFTIMRGVCEDVDRMKHWVDVANEILLNGEVR
jgi:hypothetical protein